MIALDLIREAMGAGMTLGIHGDTLQLESPVEPPADVIDRLRASKPQIMRCLPAVILQDRPRPETWPLARWKALQSDALAFVTDGWADRADALGWQPWELWGCHETASYHRIDHLGLLALLNGDRITNIDERCAVLEAGTDRELRYYRKKNRPRELTMIWEIEPPIGAVTSVTERVGAPA